MNTWLVATGLVRPQDFQNINPSKYTRFKDEFDAGDEVHILQEGQDLTVVCYDNDNGITEGFSGDTTIGFKFKKQTDGTYKVYRLKQEISTHSGNQDELDQAKAQLRDIRNLEEITDPREVARLIKALKNVYNQYNQNFCKNLKTFLDDTFLSSHLTALKNKVTSNTNTTNRGTDLANLVSFVDACTENSGADLDSDNKLKSLFEDALTIVNIDNSTFQTTVTSKVQGLNAATITNKRNEAIKKAGLDAFEQALYETEVVNPTELSQEQLNTLKPFLTLENPNFAYKVDNSIYAVSIGADFKLKYQKLTIDNGTISRSDITNFEPKNSTLKPEMLALNPNYEDIQQAFEAAREAKLTPSSLDTTNGNQEEKRTQTQKAYKDLVQAKIKEIQDEHAQLKELFGEAVANIVAVKKLKELATKSGIDSTKETEYAKLSDEIINANPLDAINPPDQSITETTLMKNLVHLAGKNGKAPKSEKQIIENIMKQIASHGGISHRQINQLRGIIEKYNRINPETVSLKDFDKEITELIEASQRGCPMSEFSSALSFNSDLYEESLKLNEFLKDTCLANLNPTTLDFDYFNYSGDKIPTQIQNKYPNLFQLITQKCDAEGLTRAKQKEFMYRALMLAEATSNNTSSENPSSVTDEAISPFDFSISKKLKETTEASRITALHSLPANTDQTDIRRFTFFTEMLHSEDPAVKKIITDINPSDRDLNKKLEALSTRVMDIADANGYSHVFSDIDPVENYKVNRTALNNIIAQDTNKAFEIAKTLGFTVGNPQNINDIARTYGFLDKNGNLDQNKLLNALETHMNNFFNTYSQAQANPGTTVGDQIKTYDQVFIKLRGLLNSGTEHSDSNIVAQPQKRKRISAQEFSRSLYEYLKFLSQIEAAEQPEASSTSSYHPKRDLPGVAIWA